VRVKGLGQGQVQASCVFAGYDWRIGLTIVAMTCECVHDACSFRLRLHASGGRKKKNRPNIRAVLFRGDLNSERFPRIGPCGPWHRGVSCPVAGPVVIWVTPDAKNIIAENCGQIQKFFNGINGIRVPQSERKGPLLRANTAALSRQSGL